MKFNYTKKKYYILIILTSLITGFLFLIAIKANNRKASPNILSNIYSLYNETLTNITAHNSKLGYNTAIPFKISLFETSSKCLSLDSNILQINKKCVNDNDIQDIITILNEISVNEYQNITHTKVNYFINKIKIFKHINFRILVDFRDESNYSNLFKKIIEKLGLDFNFYLKKLYYDAVNGIDDHGLYKMLKEYNSRTVFEELRDEESLNIIILDKKEASVANVYYNDDINQDIYELDLEKEDVAVIILNIIQYKMISNDIKKLFKNKNYLNDLVSILHSKELIYHRMILETVSNLDIFNKYSVNYESIKTFEKVKEKVDFFLN